MLLALVKRLKGQLSKMARQRREDGVGWKGNTVLRDAETQEIIYDNRDVVAMAKWSVQRGGPAAEAMDRGSQAMFCEYFENKYLMEDWICPSCKAKTNLYLSSIYVGWVHPMDETNTPMVRCHSCTKDSPPSEYKDDAHRTDCELKYPLIEQYVYIHINKIDLKYELIQNFIKDNNYKLEN